MRTLVDKCISKRVNHLHKNRCSIVYEAPMPFDSFSEYNHSLSYPRCC